MSTSPAKMIFSPKFCSFIVTASLVSGLANLTVTNLTYAAEAAIGENALVTILRATKVVPAESKLTASIAGDEVVITTTKKEGATDDANKIEAVLIAKTVFDSVANDAQRTKVIFFDFKANTYSEVAVKRAEVKMYGSGQLTEKELLSSLELKTGDAESADDDTIKVEPGPMQPERMILNGRLLKLENEGSSVKDLRQLFEQLEATAKSGDNVQTHTLYKNLTTYVHDREVALYEARHPKNLSPRVGKGRAASNAQAAPTNDQGNFLQDPLRDLFVGPHGEKIYNFTAKDLPPYAELTRYSLVGYMTLIKENTGQGRNMQVPITLMNDAIQRWKAKDNITYHNCLKELRQQLGNPVPGFSKGVDHQSFPSRQH